MSSESEFIAWIRSQQRPAGPVELAAGDDLAILKLDAGLFVVGIDQVLDGVHFDSRVHAPRLIGIKAMNRNLSDCAAMAAAPAVAVVSFALPRNFSLDSAKELYFGLKDAGEAFECAIVGGDTGVWDGPLAVTVAIMGKAVGPIVRRSGAKVGDLIYVTGPLGGSIAGRHMTFSPRVREGIALGQAGVHAMIDLSDGLSRDLHHICEQSGVGAVLDADAIPIHSDVPANDARRLEHALNDGEDYELLFTDDRPHADQHAIGRIVEGPAVLLKTASGTEPLAPVGWQHILRTDKA